jgi:FkbM family methyltransferase
MTLVSFAQNQEDIMLWRALRSVRNGFYIDVGAADPVEWSVTKLFYDHGWHGVNLEPQITYFASLSETRPHDTNLRFAAGRESGLRTFYSIDKSGLSTFDSEIAARHRSNGWNIVEEATEVLTLAEICHRYHPHGAIHFLKIDVEGNEGDVLSGADFQRFRPWIVLVEATLPMSQQESYTDWEPVLTSQGYGFVWFDGLNRFYLADEMCDELGQYFRLQPNIFDGFEPALHLLRRAEQSELDLQRTRAEVALNAGTVAEAVRSAAESFQRATTTGERSAEVVYRAAEAVQQTAATLAQQMTLLIETQRQNAELSQHRNALAHQLADAKTHLAALSEECERLREAVSEQQRQRELAAGSGRTKPWGLTAPWRTARPLPPVAVFSVIRQYGAKELARRVFHRGARLILGVPGGRRGMRLVYRIVPWPVEWLAQRYRAYEQSAVKRREGATPPSLSCAKPAAEQSVEHTSDLPHALLTDQTALPASDLSREEIRVYRQFISRASAVVTKV